MGGCVGKVLLLFGQSRRDEEEKLDYKGGNVHIINSKEIWDQKIAEANRDGKTVVANFSASWCGPCRVIAPIYAEMSKTYPQLMFLTIDVDDLVNSKVCNDTFLLARISAHHGTSVQLQLSSSSKTGSKLTSSSANKPELEKKVQATANSS
ncbi:hypothetical protein PR202_ga11397 [Eleusine coracana subsp. coracana]|uniref:Thioredoxin domain-containing protein n=1 Tax=Eleusine coracana subsp. coracana TaxID=191504 RepID=A0AAV5C8W5_ELECO|nr:hypothetical protein PR202_ga11397 [Eleusine coracana subsp. coracana]